MGHTIAWVTLVASWIVALGSIFRPDRWVDRWRKRRAQNKRHDDGIYEPWVGAAARLGISAPAARRYAQSYLASRGEALSAGAMSDLSAAIAHGESPSFDEWFKERRID